MRAPASLRGRLALWLGLALVALWLATALLTAGLMRRELDALFDSALQESAERLLPLAVNDVLGRGPADENDEDDPRILGVIAPHDEFLTYVLRDPAGRVAHHGGRSRKPAIVALARKLLVALWKYVATGVVIEGAAMKPA